MILVMGKLNISLKMQIGHYSNLHLLYDPFRQGRIIVSDCQNFTIIVILLNQTFNWIHVETLLYLIVLSYLFYRYTRVPLNYQPV
jgi:hypothetical protein